MSAREPRIVRVAPADQELDEHRRRKPRKRGVVHVSIALEGMRGQPVEVHELSYREATVLARDILAAVELAQQLDEQS